MPSRTPRPTGAARPNGPKTALDPIGEAPLSEALCTLSRRGELRRLRKGQILITEGDRGDTLFVVIAGRLRAYSEGLDGKVIEYASHGPGEYVGEMGLDGGPRSASVEATEASLVALVTRPTLEAYLQQDPSFAFDLLTTVIGRARQATRGLRSLALNDVYGRLKPLLEELGAEGDEARAPTHQQLADRLGCTRPMVTRLLLDLEQGGYVETGRRHLKLLKPLPPRW